MGEGHPEGDFDPDDLLRMFHELLDAIRDIHWRELLPVRLTMPQLKVLHILSRYGRISAGELAEMMNVSAPTVTDILDRMSALGLVTRERGQEDRRVVYVSATSAGEAAFRAVLQERWSILRELFGTMRAKERRAVGEGLQALRAALRRFRTEEKGGTGDQEGEPDTRGPSRVGT